MAVVELPGLYVDNVASIVAVERPLLVNRDPGPGEVGVPLDWPIALEVLDPGADGIDRAATQVWVDGVLAFDGGAAPELQPGFDGPHADVVESADTLRIVLDPTTPFASLTTVEVRVVSATVGGEHALDETYTFQAEDRTAPKVLAAQATAPRVVHIGFDEPVLVVDPAGFALVPVGRPAVGIEPVDAEADGSVVVITLDTEMTPDVAYEVVVNGVTDLHGNAVAAPDDRATFSGFRPPRPLGRRFDLWTMLPRHNRRADVTGDLRRFIACLQEVADLLLAEGDRFADIFDLERAPEPFLDLILQDLGNPFP
ncbi:MAG: Ig-like domain-containing protein, partial [Myxococcales bacterium]|nr:Ig-like domain-containing protein [Myxococcales bacterium]